MNKEKLLEALYRLSETVEHEEHNAHEANGIDRAIRVVEEFQGMTVHESLEWNDGAPPDFSGYRDIWIVAEIPSRWIEGQCGYRCFKWMEPKGWTDKEALRAQRWALLALPV